MYLKPTGKDYGVLCKYKTPEKSMRIPCNRVNVIFYQQGVGKQSFPPVAGTNDFLHRDVICYNCDSTSHYFGQYFLPDHCSTGTQFIQLGYYFSETTPY